MEAKKNGQPIQIGWLIIGLADQQQLSQQLPVRAAGPIV
jgi:hypothetical protein